ncbi:S24 family peptidase [Ancylobacter sp. SL191]|uniref:S24 family peptidase n=1 Tax=Ancylobacter sp. SL191 TaxID=2995166 RepID=UPI00226FA6D6|nr:S24 family peptidase [Ancylobacter sp. SL191]WAC26398.1 hypothetical protein OU996_15435 [Ancylobacter sp. SL191]
MSITESGFLCANTQEKTRVSSRSMSEGDEIFQRIQRRMKQLKLTEYTVKRELKTDIVRSIRVGLEKGTQTGVSTRTLRKLAPVLRTTPEWLLTGEGEEDTGISRETPTGNGTNGADTPTMPFDPAAASSVEDADIAAPFVKSFQRNVPVMGTAAGSIIRKVEGFSLEPEVVDYVRRPPALADRKDIYALYVSGLSMEPMHTHGDLRFIDPRQRPQIGDSVIVVTRTHDDDPGQAYIKILAKRTPSAVVLKQLNPEAMIEIPEKFILQMHRVMTMNDLFGV